MLAMAPPAEGERRLDDWQASRACKGRAPPRSKPIEIKELGWGSTIGHLAECQQIATEPRAQVISRFHSPLGVFCKKLLMERV